MRWVSAVSCLSVCLTHLKAVNLTPCNAGGLAAKVMMLSESSHGARGDSKGSKSVTSVYWQCYYSSRCGREVFLTYICPTFLLNVRSHASDVTDYSYPATPNHSVLPQPVAPSYAVGDAVPLGPANQALEHEHRPASASAARHMALNRPQQPPPPPPAAEGPQASAPTAPADYG